MITLTYFREALDLPPAQNDQVVLLRAEMISLWEQCTDWLWDARTGYVQEGPPPTERSPLFGLNLRAVSAVTKVEVRESRDDPDWTELDAEDWMLEGQPGMSFFLVRRSARWEPRVRVTYSGGFGTGEGSSPPPAPLDIQRALVIQAKFSRARYTKENVAVRGQSFGQGNATFLESKPVHPVFAEAVQRWRRMGL